MSQLSAFELRGKSFTITVGVANQVTPVNLSDLGMTQIPDVLQFINNGTADVWLVLSSTAAPVAAFPTPGTTTVGTPQPGLRLKPGAIVVYRCNASVIAQNVPNAAGNQVGPGFYMATISGTAAQPIDVSPGEGI
jgi:hypothetical protein